MHFVIEQTSWIKIHWTRYTDLLTDINGRKIFLKKEKKQKKKCKKVRRMKNCLQYTHCYRIINSNIPSALLSSRLKAAMFDIYRHAK